MVNEIEESFAEVLLRVAAYLSHRQPVDPYVQRYENRLWRSRMRNFTRIRLSTEFSRLLRRCSFREIARLHARFFYDNRLAVETAAAHVRNQRMASLRILRRLLDSADDFAGKFFIMII